ncbi:glycosyltransferase family 4 protein [Halovenus sp. HT40]|uniref:glycosyltransferase family 4 protein n=1 Tax=Halovenus sp. HT40 TaxID=3126691 RepID=UPI00300EC384
MDSKLRILLSPSIFPPESGGPATFMPELGSSLLQRGHKIKVVTNGKPHPNIDNNFEYEIVRTGEHKSTISRYLSQIRALKNASKRFKPDVIVSNGSDFPPAVVSKLTGIPLVSKVVGDSAWERARRRGNVTDGINRFQKKSYGFRVKVFKLLRNFEANSADRIIVPSDYLKQIVLSWDIPRSKVVKIYNSINISVDAPSHKKRGTDILTVARLVGWKGIKNLISAFENLAAQHSKPHLHILGDGRKRTEFEEYAQSTSVSDRIHFHGRVPHNKVLEHMKRCRVFVLNSSYEGLPHVVLEAMACGLPAIVSNAGGNTEVVNDRQTGFIIDPDNVEELSKKMCDLISSDDKFAEFQREAIKLLNSKFNHANMIDRYEHTLIDISQHD